MFPAKIGLTLLLVGLSFPVLPARRSTRWSSLCQQAMAAIVRGRGDRGERASEEKTEKATPKKRKESRKEGRSPGPRSSAPGPPSWPSRMAIRSLTGIAMGQLPGAADHQRCADRLPDAARQLALLRAAAASH